MLLYSIYFLLRAQKLTAAVFMAAGVKLSVAFNSI